MFSQYFGNYLLNTGLITSEQLQDALELQKSTHVKFGVLAVDEGYLTARQVEEVHERQKQVDKRFGEIAVELGYLTDSQVEQMLSAQKQDHLLLAQALVDREYMTIESYSNALNEYKVKHSLTDDKFEAIKSGDIETIVENSLNLDETSDKELFSKFLSLFAKNMIRFIDDQVFLEVQEKKEEMNYDLFVHQQILGETPLFTAIAADEKIFLEIASVYAEEELTEVDELAEASVSEFLNLHNGIFLVNMSNDGIELNMHPQKVTHKVQIQPSPSSYLINVHTSKGQFTLLLSRDPKEISIAANEDSTQLV